MNNLIKKFLMSIILFFFLLSNISPYSFKRFKNRNLLEISAVDKICASASSEVNEFFASGGTSLEDKEFDDNKEYIQKLLDLIEKKGDKNEAINIYLKHLTPILFFIVFGIVSILIWPISLCCMCCRCCNYCIRCFFCCCSLKIKKRLTNIFFFVALGFFTFGVIFSIVGISKIFILFQTFDDGSCSIFKIITESVNGQETANKPRWDGIDGVNQILIDLGNAVIESMDNYKAAFKEAKENMDQKKELWITDVLDYSYNQVNSKKLTLNTFKIENGVEVTYSNIIPEYIKNYGPYTQSKTFLNNLNTEYNTLTNSIYTILDNAYNLVDTSLTENVVNKLNEATEEISTLGENFDKLSEDIAEPWMKNQDKIKDFISGLSKAISVIVLFNCVEIIFNLVMIKFCKNCKSLECIFKLVFYVFYSLLFLFTILVFVVFGFIGIIGIIAKDCASVAHFIFSESNLKSEEPRVVKKGKSSNYLNTCVNGNGDLKEAFNFDSSMSDLDDLYHLGDTINEYSETIASQTTPVTITAFQLLDYGNKYLNFKYYDSSGVDQNVYRIVDEMNKYTKHDSNTYQDQSTNYYNEMWSTVSLSTEGYRYYNTINNMQTSYNSKYLLNIYDSWTSENLQSRYANSVNLKSTKGYDTVASGTSNLYSVLLELKSKNNEIYNSVSSVNSNIKTKYSEIISLIVTSLSKAVDAIQPLINALNDYLGDNSNSIYSIMNCAFIGYDVKFLLKQLYGGIGQDFYDFGCIMITMGICITLGLYLSSLHFIFQKDVFIEEGKTDDNDNNDVGKSEIDKLG